MQAQIYRGGVTDTAIARFYSGLGSTTSGHEHYITARCLVIDSPSTTSAITYNIQGVVSHLSGTKTLVKNGSGYNYNNANQSAMYNHYENGSVVNMWQNSSNSYSEVVIDTVGTGTSNRWGAIAIYATDDLGQSDKIEIVQYAFNASASRLYT